GPAAPRAKRLGSWPIACLIVACPWLFFVVVWTVQQYQALQAIPVEYRPYFNLGKVTATGNASLDYWVETNLSLHGLERFPNQATLPQLLRIIARVMRKRSVEGVDPDLAGWTDQVTNLLEV